MVDVVVGLDGALPVDDDPHRAAPQVVAHHGLPLVPVAEVLEVAAFLVLGARGLAVGGGADKGLNSDGVLPEKKDYRVVLDFCFE